MTPHRAPDALFRTRRRNPALPGPNPYEWCDVTTDQIFAGQRVVLFAVPGAFTPACSETHLPGFEQHYDDFIALGIDAVICLSVNDAFIMHQWARSQNIEKVRMLPDGNGEFTRKMGMLVDRSSTGMGMRSWRYAMLVEDGVITKLFAEPDLRDNPAGVPVTVSDAPTMLDYLRHRTTG
jgi:peroxiredoxin